MSHELTNRIRQIFRDHNGAVNSDDLEAALQQLINKKSNGGEKPESEEEPAVKIPVIPLKPSTPKLTIEEFYPSMTKESKPKPANKNNYKVVETFYPSMRRG